MKYLDAKDTPLRFHRIYSRIVLPLDSFLNLVNFFSLLQIVVKEGGGIQDYLNLALVIVFIVLCFAAFRGLMCFRRSGFIAATALLSIQILDNIYRTIVYLQSGALAIGLAAVFSVGVLAVILSYYWRRRRLFTREGLSLEELLELYGNKGKKSTFQSRYETVQELHEEMQEEPEEEVGEYDCPRCGFHIADGAVFCPKCGAQTRTVRR